MSFAGKTVAIVGRSASIIGSRQGKRIDACDVVVRVNTVLPLDANLLKDTGERTDWVFHCRSCNDPRDAALARNVGVIEQSSRYRKRLGKRVKLLGYRPYTGTVAIFQILDWGAREVHAMAMDLHMGPRTDGTRGSDFPYFAPTKPASKRWRHDAALDRKLLRTLMGDPRFRPDPALIRVLAGRKAA